MTPRVFVSFNKIFPQEIGIINYMDRYLLTYYVFRQIIKSDAKRCNYKKIGILTYFIRYSVFYPEAYPYQLSNTYLIPICYS